MWTFLYLVYHQGCMEGTNGYIHDLSGSMKVTQLLTETAHLPAGVLSCQMPHGRSVGWTNQGVYVRCRERLLGVRGLVRNDCISLLCKVESSPWWNGVREHSIQRIPKAAMNLPLVISTCSGYNVPLWFTITCSLVAILPSVTCTLSKGRNSTVLYK